MNYPNTICADIFKDDVLSEKEGTWDYILLGEVLEHIDNPVSFIEEIRKKYNKKVSKIILTVPNILTVNTIRNIKHGIEHINTDHRYWFTPYTISKVVACGGYIGQEIYFANRTSLNKWELAIRRIKKIFGVNIRYDCTYFDTIIVIADIA